MTLVALIGISCYSFGNQSAFCYGMFSYYMLSCEDNCQVRTDATYRLLVHIPGNMLHYTRKYCNHMSTIIIIIIIILAFNYHLIDSNG
jgi:hypothetical protein